MEELGNSENDKRERRRYQREQWKENWQQSWSEGAPKRRRKRGVFGLVLVLFGTWWLLRRMDLLIMPEWIMTWPVLLMTIGVVHLMVNGFRGAGGYIMVFIGSVFLVKNQFGIPLNVEEYFWPVVVIVLGLIILFKPSHKHDWKKKRCGGSSNIHNPQSTVTDDSDLLDSFVMFGGIQKDVISKSFKGGDVTCVMGGAELYMSKADMESTATIDLTVVMGGVKLVVPQNWDVIVKTTNILGGVDDKRRKDPAMHSENQKTLIIDGTLVMGGIEIKSY